jgi:hypothetical protein
VRTQKFQLAAAAIVAASVMSGCSSAKHAAPPACRPARAPEYPTTDAALDDPDAGGTYCVRVGETLTVTLHVPPGGSSSGWQSITPSDRSVLEPVSNGVVALPRGVTATFFSVRKPGVVTVTSSRGPSQVWKATVVARAK